MNNDKVIDTFALLSHVELPPEKSTELWKRIEDFGLHSHHNKPKRSKKWWLSFGVPAAVVILGGTTVAATSILSNYSAKLRTASHTQGVFEYVNGTPVTNEQFQTYKIGQQLVAQMNHQVMPSQADILHQFNLEQVAYQEAQKEHLVVTDKQALDYSLQMQHMLENPPANADKANFAQIEQILKAQEKGLGVSDNQYWTQVAPKNYKVGMSIGNLRNHFTQRYQLSHPGVQYSGVRDAWVEYESQLLSRATIRQVSK